MDQACPSHNSAVLWPPSGPSHLRLAHQRKRNSDGMYASVIKEFHFFQVADSRASRCGFAAVPASRLSASVAHLVDYGSDSVAHLSCGGSSEAHGSPPFVARPPCPIAVQAVPFQQSSYRKFRMDSLAAPSYQHWQLNQQRRCFPKRDRSPVLADFAGVGAAPGCIRRGPQEGPYRCMV